jgi:hypothetical protein
VIGVSAVFCFIAVIGAPVMLNIQGREEVGKGDGAS